jgi:hypothetical protein
LQYCGSRGIEEESEEVRQIGGSRHIHRELELRAAPLAIEK